MLRNPTRLLYTLCSFVVAFLSLASGDAFPNPEAVSTCRQVQSVSWLVPQTQADKTKLDQWCQSVGPALFHTPAGFPAPGKGRLLVIDWNMHVGNGDMQALIRKLTAEEEEMGRGQPDFVFLLQEVFRRGADVPSKWEFSSSVPRRIESSSMDIDALAKALNWWLFYVPSMRNGQETGIIAEDRGNAILSSLPLVDLQAIELPFAVQRRVAVSAIVHDKNRDLRFRVATVHFDTRAPWTRGFVFGAWAARNRQAKWLLEALNVDRDDDLALIIGGDLNSYLGPLEFSIRTLSRAAPHVECGGTSTHITGLTLDHFFVRVPATMSTEPCRRLENRFESDHYPLVLPFSLN